jgi:hypothetical protein
MKASMRSRRGVCGGILLTAATLLVVTGAVRAQDQGVGGGGRGESSSSRPVGGNGVGTATRADSSATTAGMPAPVLPSSVLLFPAVIPGDEGAAAPAAAGAAQSAGPTANTARPVAEGIITDAVRRFLNRGGVGVVVYNRRLAAMERAVAEGLRPEEALRGPGDDPRKARQFAEILGANEYLTVLIDDYKYDPASRTATFNLSVARNAADGTSLGATAQKAVGTAPADIPASRREAYAVSSAADVVAQQTVESIYPGAAIRINPPKQPEKKRRRGVGNLLIPAIAVGAAIIGTRT